MFGPPKSDAGIRVVSLPSVIAEDVTLHLANFAQDGKDGLIFTGPTGLPLRHGNFHRRVWLGAATKAGLEGVHFHDLSGGHRKFVGGQAAVARSARLVAAGSCSLMRRSRSFRSLAVYFQLNGLAVWL